MAEKTFPTVFSESDIESQQVDMKVGILATVNDQGLPHLTMISSLQANSPTGLVFGQFTEGLSKGYIQRNPKIGFLIMTLDRDLWRGKAALTHTATGGPEFEMYNNIPMFRYNAYFGIHTVYYLELLEHRGRQPLPMMRIIPAALKTMAARMLSSGNAQREVMNTWTRQLMNKLNSLKFLGYIGKDGFPVVIPVIQAQALGSDRIIFSASAYGDELAVIPEKTPTAVFGLTLDMEDVLLRGAFEGISRFSGFRCGVVSLDWVYNSMPPTPGQIYPETAIEPVTVF